MIRQISPFVAVPLLCLACSFLGCTSTEAPAVAADTEDGRMLAELVERLGSHTKDRKKFRAYFVEGAAPDDDRKKYSDLVIVGPPHDGRSIAEDIQVNGDSAVIKVRLIYGANEEELDAEGNSKFFDWEAQKVDGKWKLKSAPLPSAV